MTRWQVTCLAVVAVVLLEVAIAVVLVAWSYDPPLAP